MFSIRDFFRNGLLTPKAMMVGVVVGAVLGLVLSMVVEPSYQSRALIALGSVSLKSEGDGASRTRYIEDPRLTVIRWSVFAKHRLDAQDNASKDLHDLVVLMYSHEGVIQVTSRASTAELAQQAASDLASRIVADQKPIYDGFIHAVEDSRHVLQEVRKEIDSSKGGAPIKPADLDQFLSGRVALEYRQVDLTSLAINSSPTQIIQEAELPNKPIYPNVPVTVILGALIGFFSVSLIRLSAKKP